MNVHDDMSDTEVLDAARDFLSGMPLGGPPDVEAIMAGGRARRRRRLIPGVTGTLALAAGAVLAVTALVPGRQPAREPSRQPSVQLAAWSVTEQSNGDINVVVRQLEDPSGLQSTLRADGVPASVTFLPQLNRACQSYPGGKPTFQQIVTPLLEEVFPKPYENVRAQLPTKKSGAPTSLGLAANTTFIVIDPSALPGNAGVQLAVSPRAASPSGASFSGPVLLPDLVYTNPECTGS